MHEGCIMWWVSSRGCARQKEGRETPISGWIVAELVSEAEAWTVGPLHTRDTLI
jgi:hypothetical protein